MGSGSSMHQDQVLELNSSDIQSKEHNTTQVVELEESNNELHHGEAKAPQNSDRKYKRNAWAGSDPEAVSKKTVSFFDTGTKVDELAPYEDEPPQGGTLPVTLMIAEKQGPAAEESETRIFRPPAAALALDIGADDDFETGAVWQEPVQVLDAVVDDDDLIKQKRDKRIEILCIKLHLNSKTITSDKLRPSESDPMMQELKQLLVRREKSWQASCSSPSPPA